MHARPEVSLPPRSWGWTRAYRMLRRVFRNDTRGRPMVRGLESADCRPPKATHQPAHLPGLDGWRRPELGARRREWVGRLLINPLRINWDQCQPEMSRRPGGRR